MKEWINIAIRKIIRLLLHVFYIIPIKSNRIIFESYGGKSYNCNPKYICEYINKHYKEKFEMIWVFEEPQKYQNIDYIKAINKHSFGFFFYRFSSKFIICNKTDEVYLPKRKNQVVINTWHAGGAYKRVGLSYDKTYNKATAWQDEIVRKETSIYVSSSELFTKYNIHEAYKYFGEILNSGMPRNDCFFEQSYLSETRRKIDYAYNTKNKLIILYAPTFRGDYENNQKIDFTLPIDKISSLFKKKSNKSVVVLNRSHYNDKNQLKVEEGCSDKQVINVNDYDDMQELLAASDVLITDYSSSMWDYALLNRPCFLFVPDIDEYCDDRGTYTPIEWWPGFICKNEKELFDQILKVSNRDIVNKNKLHFQKYGSFEKGTASKMIVDRMIDIANI